MVPITGINVMSPGCVNSSLKNINEINSLQGNVFLPSDLQNKFPKKISCIFSLSCTSSYFSNQCEDTPGGINFLQE